LRRPTREGHLGAVNKHVLLYGLLGGLLIALLKAVEYRFLVVEYSVQIYGGLIAAIFAGLGVWLGLRLTRPAPPPPTVVTTAPAPAATPFVRDPAQIERLGVTPRELEILELIAQGLSNREIAETLFVSENTVKTHSSRLFDKLGARRRTQAVQLGKQRGLIA
jgi:NarL family two-component system response regulator LiaR